MTLQRQYLYALVSVLLLGLLASPAFAGAAGDGVSDVEVVLSGRNEVPPVPSTRTGGCSGTFDEAVPELTIVCHHDVTNATTMHIHSGPQGVNGPVVFGLGDPASPVSATWSGMTPADVADLLAEELYVNIHTDGRPGGEIRGQIRPFAAKTFFFFADGGQQVPPDVSTATATCFGDLPDPTLFSLACTHDVGQPTVAHLHQGARGSNGPVLFDLGDATSPIIADLALTPSDLAELLGSLLYLNIHSTDSPEGEIRGQVSTRLIFSDGFESGDLAVWPKVQQ